jgi:iron-sulfur cluster assembly accessory protein
MMSEEQSTQMNITDNAAKQISVMRKENGPTAFLKITVKAGGCSGFQYEYQIVHDRADGDVEVKHHSGESLLVDEFSLVNFLSGSELDYIDDLGNARFKIENKNATAKCGCGTSFNI